MQTQQVNFTKSKAVERGTTVLVRITIAESNQAIDFSQATIDARVGKKYGSARSLTFTPTYLARSTDGFVAELKLSSTQTLELRAGVYYWEAFLKLSPAADPVWCVARGQFDVEDILL